MRKVRIIFLSFLTIIFLSAFSRAEEIAIVVNKTNPVKELSLKDLIKIFKAERQYWDGEKVHILMRESGSWEKEIILKKIYQMSDVALQKFWLGKIFRGEVSDFPLVFSSASMIKRLIKENPGAIGFIDLSSIDGEIKVIRIEGKLPQDEGYPLREIIEEGSKR